jgi:isopenicillin-N N-acyltransferase-like protein
MSRSGLSGFVAQNSRRFCTYELAADRCEQIGFAHGKGAKETISRSVTFYERVFQENAKLGWAEVEQFAMEFMPLMLKNRAFFEEMQGLGHGAGFNMATIMALNARTEIMYGMIDDGCTSLAWKAKDASWLAQNWDWQVEQKENLIVLDVTPANGKPRYKIVTEAGILGKIGLNDAGVGVCLNAIRAKGVNVNKLPVHLGLKIALECRSRDEAVKRLETFGIASACTIVIADGASGGIALECSAEGIEKIEQDGRNRIFHSNHFLKPQDGVVDTQMPRDTLQRIERIEHLADDLEGDLTHEKLRELFKDEQNLPTAICRAKGGESNGATLFNIVSDLKRKEALVSLGRPSEPDEELWLKFV